MTTDPMETVEPKLKKLDTLWWAVALIWAGVVFGAESLDFLPQVGDAEVWSWIFIGAGLFGLVLNFYSLSADEYQDPTTWDWIWSGGLTLVGAAAFVYLFSKRDRVRYVAMALMGLGMVFFGLELMKNGFSIVKNLPAFEAWFDTFTAET